jgi:hypothetical protein
MQPLDRNAPWRINVKLVLSEEGQVFVVAREPCEQSDFKLHKNSFHPDSNDTAGRITKERRFPSLLCVDIFVVGRLPVEHLVQVFVVHLECDVVRRKGLEGHVAR